MTGNFLLDGRGSEARKEDYIDQQFVVFISLKVFVSTFLNGSRVARMSSTGQAREPIFKQRRFGCIEFT